MERARARSMRRSASASKSGGKSRSARKSKGRSRRGGEELDAEMGFGPEAAASDMEEGRSPSPPTTTMTPTGKSSTPPPTTSNPFSFNPKGDEMVGGKRGKKSKGRSRRGGEELDAEMGFGPESAANEMEKGRSPSPPTTTMTPTGKSSTPPPTTSNPFSFNPKGDEMVGGKRRKRGKKSMNKKYKKGSKSKTRKGRKNFVTHKGDKYYNRKGDRHSNPQKKKGLFDQLFGL